MSESTISFPKGCFFCKTNFQSQDCLLPFSVITKFRESEITFNEVIQITELHHTYGNSILEHNAAMEKLNSSKGDEKELKRLLNYNILVLQTGNLNINKNPIMEDLNIRDYKTESTQTNDDYNVINSNTNSQMNTEIQNTGSKRTDKYEELSRKLDQSFTSKTNSKTWSDIVTDELDQKEASSTDAKVAVKPAKMEQSTIQHEIVDENHFIEDMLMIIKTAHTIQSTPRARIKFQKLCDSITHEMLIITSKGKYYKPTTKGELDGEIALSKQMAARHTIAELEMWESDEQSDKGVSCILNCRNFATKVALQSEETLEMVCIKSFNTLMLSTQLVPQQKRDIIDSIRFQLEREGYNDTYSWIHKRSKLEQRIGSTTAEKGKMRDVSSTQRKWTQLAKYPEANPKLLEHIDHNLDGIVHKIIKESKVNFTTLGDQRQIVKHFHTLSSEFLKRNKGWHNENSFTTSAHLTKIQNILGIEVAPAEAFKTFKVLKNIIDEFRNSFKLKYGNETMTN